MKIAQAQPDFRLTENLLSLNSGSQKFFSPNFDDLNKITNISLFPSQSDITYQ